MSFEDKKNASLMALLVAMVLIVFGTGQSWSDSGAAVTTVPPGSVIVVPPSSGSGPGASVSGASPELTPGPYEKPPSVSSSQNLPGSGSAYSDSRMGAERPRAAFPSAPGPPPQGTSAPDLGTIQPPPGLPPRNVPGPVAVPGSGDMGAAASSQPPDVIVITPAQPQPSVQDRGITPQQPGIIVTPSPGASSAVVPEQSAGSGAVSPAAPATPGDAGVSAKRPETVYSDTPGAPSAFTGAERGGSELVPGGTPVPGSASAPSISGAQSGSAMEPGKPQDRGVSSGATAPSAAQPSPPPVPDAAVTSKPPSGSMPSASGDRGGAAFPSAPGPAPQGTSVPKQGTAQVPPGTVTPPDVPSGLKAAPGDTGASQEMPVTPRTIPRY